MHFFVRRGNIFFFLIVTFTLLLSTFKRSWEIIGTLKGAVLVPLREWFCTVRHCKLLKPRNGSSPAVVPLYHTRLHSWTLWILDVSGFLELILTSGENFTGITSPEIYSLKPILTRPTLISPAVGVSEWCFKFNSLNSLKIFSSLIYRTCRDSLELKRRNKLTGLNGSIVFYSVRRTLWPTRKCRNLEVENF